jgi:hypothetical protein
VGLCALAVSCVLAGPAAAATGTLVGITFDDGGTASGTFAYDAPTNTYSDINITTTAGSSRAGAVYTFVCTDPCVGVTPSDAGALYLTTSSAADQSGLPGFALFFSSISSGVLAVDGQEADCSDPVCTSPAPPARFVVSGTVVFDPQTIPTLSEWGMILLVLSLVTIGMWRLAVAPAPEEDTRRKEGS